MKLVTTLILCAVLVGGCAISRPDPGAPYPRVGMDTTEACYHTSWGIADGLSYQVRADGTVVAVARWTLGGRIKTVTLVNDKVTAVTVY